MKNVTSLVIMLVLAGLGTVGCQNKSTSEVPVNESVTDVTASPSGTYNSTPPAYSSGSSAPVAQPVTYDTMPSSGAGASGNSYTVKRGDTLYSIARTKYGDGKQWQKIVSANPGLKPESLKVGQTISLP